MSCCPAPCDFQCYVQPPRRPICRPCDSDILPKDCVECCTVYKKSFCPPGCAKRAPLRQHDNLKPAVCKLETNTIHKLSFPCLPVVKTCPILPCNRNIIGEGPLSRVTTQRHDYVPKCVPKIPPIVPPAHLRCSTEPMDCTTVMNASYLPVCGGKQRSYRPIIEYCKPQHPFQDETVSRLSYVPWPLKQKEHYPWACKGAYVCPKTPMESCTIMTSSYLANCCPRRPTCTPVEHNVLNKDDKGLECCTVYKKSFCPPGCAKRAPLRQHDNLKPAVCKLDANTIHKLSFPCLPVVKTCPILPCNRNIIGEGPLSCVTTQRHDFVPKCVPKIPSIVPPAHLRCSTEPMDCTTVMNASYLPVCGGKQRSYRPIIEYCKPQHPFQDETVARLSYVPWPLKQKEHYPWACKGKYVTPCVPLECTSIYQASFPAPGTFNGRCPAPCCPAPACCPPAACKAACFDDC